MRSRLLAALLLAACADAPADQGYEPKQHLSQLGLFADMTTKEPAPDIVEVTPAYPLWSDGAEKHRFLRLPGEIDTSHPDAWRFPSGTQLFKEFSLDGKRLETRLIDIHDGGVELLTYAWRDDESDADLLEEGASDVRGTSHDIPETAACMDCHQGEPGRVLGVSAVQLAGHLPEGVSLSDGIPEYVVPGDAVTQAALGTLHANCGSCHTPGGYAAEQTGLTLRLGTSESTPESTAIYQTAVGVGLSSWRTMDYETIVVPGDPDHSALVARMERRDQQAMPPLASEVVDAEGAAAVRAWIATLSP